MRSEILNNGVKIPSVGYGVFQVFDQKVCQHAVEDAIEVGYRHIDTAAIYMNETAVGAGIKNSGIKREDIFVSTKVWVKDHGDKATLNAFDSSLKKMGLHYLDLFLIHKPFGDYYGAWRAMEQLYNEGRVRAIGLCSFDNNRVQDLFTYNEIKPHVNQIETNVWYQRKDEEKFLKENCIQQEAWSPFAEGKNDLYNNPLLMTIAKKYNKSIRQVILRWLNQRNIVVLSKTVKRELMIENLDIFDFKLSEEDMKLISTLDTGKSVVVDPSNKKITFMMSQLKHQL